MKIIKSYETTLPVEKIFQAWISEDSVVPPVTKIFSNPVVGGEYILETRGSHPLSVVKMIGEFLEVEKNSRLKYTWHWEGIEETTIVTVDFLEVDRQTQVNILHEGFLTEESKQMHDSGWDSYWAGLIEILK